MRFGRATAFVALLRIGPCVKPYVNDATRRKGEHDALITNNDELRIVMVGKTGAGKSATGNTILGRTKGGEAFVSKFKTKSVTVNCQKVRGVMAGEKVAVIDTPGLFDTKQSNEIIEKELRQCMQFASPGPHVFLIVIQLGRFTEEEQEAVKRIQNLFGHESDAYSMILFTKGDQLEDQTVDELLEDDPELQGIIDSCGGRYHVFNNKTQDPSQARELLVKINSMVEKNGGSHYTTEMFQATERALEEEKLRLLRENEEQRNKERAELEEKYKREAQKKDEEIRKMQERYEREARAAAEGGFLEILHKLLWQVVKKLAGI